MSSHHTSIIRAFSAQKNCCCANDGGYLPLWTNTVSVHPGGALIVLPLTTELIARLKSMTEAYVDAVDRLQHSIYCDISL